MTSGIPDLQGGEDIMALLADAAPDTEAVPATAAVVAESDVDVLASLDVTPSEPAVAVESAPDPVADTPVAPAPEGGIRFSTRRFVIQAQIEKASSVVPSKDIMPVLKNFQVEVTPQRLRVVATDLELSIISTTEMVLTQSSGTVVFPAQKIREILRSADEGDVVFTISADGVAHIEAGRTSWDLKLQTGEDYPPMPELADIDFVTVDRASFLHAIASVRYAAAKDATRQSLMMLDITSGKMTACDGVRFQQANLGEQFPAGLDMQIPIGAVDDLVRLLRSTELDEIQIGLGEFHLVFRVGSDVFVANKLMATFPDVEQLLLRPALENKQKLEVDRAEFVEAIKRVRINADDTSSAIGLRFKSAEADSPAQLTIIARDTFGNAAEETLTVSWTGQDRLVVVNHVFLSEMLSMYDASSCAFYFGTDTKSRKSPVMLRDDETHTVGVIQQMMANLVGYSD